MLRIIAGTAGGRRIESPPGQDLRPMMDKVRAALFDMLWHFDAIQGRVLDMYAGSGAVGMEALSRGADFADFIEFNSTSARTIQSNLESIGLAAQGRVHRRKAEDVIAKPALLGFAGPYNLISITPPYEEVDYPTLAQKVAASTLVGPGTVVIFEHSKYVEMAEAIGPLVRLRDRRYGGTRISIYEFPLESDDTEDEGHDDVDDEGSDE
ncbi:MAG: 16S rRNA (guanine(966)-N(2))-methyltransferase RsmD [Ardenticatenales bacterium]|nr:16S rRNA (guanine(966)-N(2))-methyltransferase RsmD [Ardenticatenales bacterium]